jgi:putative phosphoribosyl transferase
MGEIRDTVAIGPHRLEGSLVLPSRAAGLIIFAHGSGSSRHSPRNTRVAEQLNEARFGTLLFDLLTGPESGDRHNVFDIPLLGGRVVNAVEWVRAEPLLQALPVGLFGASTGAAAALVAAAALPGNVEAVVSRGGRPDLAAAALARVESPTLLIVGENDPEVLELNRSAQARMHCPTSLTIVPGATHLFEEPGTLDMVVEAAIRWFEVHLDGARHE